METIIYILFLVTTSLLFYYVKLMDYDQRYKKNINILKVILIIQYIGLLYWGLNRRFFNFY
jgi:hypothetical protein